MVHMTEWLKERGLTVITGFLNMGLLVMLQNHFHSVLSDSDHSSWSGERELMKMEIQKRGCCFCLVKYTLKKILECF